MYPDVPLPGGVVAPITKTEKKKGLLGGGGRLFGGAIRSVGIEGSCMDTLNADGNAGDQAMGM